MKTKHAKFSEKRAYVCVSGDNCSFFKKFGVLFFLETPVLRLALLVYYRRIAATIAERDNGMGYRNLREMEGIKSL